MAMRILIVDDEPSIGTLLRYQLRELGYEASYVSDGLLALERLEREQPDLVLLDVMMPVMSGWEVCREIRACSSVPVIMLTAKSSDMDVATGLRAGADDYIAKPFSIVQLQARIEAVLRRAGRHAAAADGSHRGAGRRVERSGAVAPRGLEERGAESSARVIDAADGAPIAHDAPMETASGGPDPAAPLQNQAAEHEAPGLAEGAPGSTIGHSWIGRRLHEVRQAKGLSLHQIERATRVRWDYLQAIEQENFDYIPRPYRRLTLSAYAHYLGVDPDQLVSRPGRRNPQPWRSTAALAAILLALVVVSIYLL